MNRFRISILSVLLTAAVIFTASIARTEGDDSGKGYIDIGSWLLMGPVETPPPAFYGDEDQIGSFLLSYRFIPEMTPSPERGGTITFAGAGEEQWNEAEMRNGELVLDREPESISTAYLAAYIELDRWAKMKFRVSCSYPFILSIDGESVIESGSGKKGGEYETGSAGLKRGKHLIVLKTVAVPADSIYPWKLNAGYSPEEGTEAGTVLSIDPLRKINIHDILDPPHIRNVQLSNSGKLAAITISRIVSDKGDRETETRIIRSKTGELLRTITHGEGRGGIRWAGRENKLSYTVSGNGSSTIRLIDLDRGTDRVLARGIERMGGHSWSDDNDFIIYSASREREKEESGVKRLRGLYDRKSYGRSRSDLYILSVEDGVSRKLTRGDYSARLLDIHPDGNRILVSRNYEMLESRPYSKTELYSIEIESMKSELLWEGAWFSDALYSPDGKKILITGGPSTFGEAGVNVPENTVPNDYDGQAFIMNPEDRSVEAITREFSPSILDAEWSESDGKIYFTAGDRSFVRLFRYSPGSGKFDALETGCEVVSNADIADGAKVALYAGESANKHRRLFRINTGGGKGKVIMDPAGDHFENIRTSEVKEWNFETGSGKNITGRVHYPPDFDPSGTYPCIVYYYGGTSPVSRSFGGRYPKNLWAAMGYVVYVLQPSGATGFGQEFSAVHVNDWGKTTSGEIIEGTRKFLEAHPFVDPARVGCIGASFGGFMTQLLITRTDMFAAAVSHAGISSISSYWGEGYWGYAYNAVSAANSFPWNNPELYIDQSALYSADKINTPLLLLHGASDTNVPPGESEQMYTALKLLGREVEYIKFAGQDHFILDYRKRISWSDAIIAWFDKWLKKEKEWWNEMYPPLDTPPAPVGVHNIETEDYGTVLIGNMEREDFGRYLPSWFADYSPDPMTASRIGDHLEDIDITCVFGSWCSDSRRDIPRMWRVMEMAGYPDMRIDYLAVGSSRFTTDSGIPAKLLRWSDRVKEYYDVERVATFIVYRNGREIGRIIESPGISLEKDLLKILQKQEAGG